MSETANATVTSIDKGPVTRAEYQRMQIEIAAINAKLDLILSKVDLVAGEVGPTIEALMKSPMLKMLIGNR